MQKASKKAKVSPSVAHLRAELLLERDVAGGVSGDGPVAMNEIVAALEATNCHPLDAETEVKLVDEANQKWEQLKEEAEEAAEEEEAAAEARVSAPHQSTLAKLKMRVKVPKAPAGERLPRVPVDERCPSRELYRVYSHPQTGVYDATLNQTGSQTNGRHRTHRARATRLKAISF